MMCFTKYAITDCSDGFGSNGGSLQMKSIMSVKPDTFFVHWTKIGADQ